MTVVLWSDGSLRQPGEPSLSAMNHGFLLGDGVFETIAVRAGVPFALSRHLSRLQYDADRLGLGDIPTGVVQAGIDAVLAAGAGAIGRLRVTVTAGTGPMGTARGTEPLTIAVAGGPAIEHRSCIAVRAPWTRNERSAVAGVKSTSYAENVIMHRFAVERGADEALLANTHGDLCEGTGSNVFIERRGEIVTPPLASGCLPGIARGLALEWGVQAGIPIRVGAPGELEMGVLDEVADGRSFAALSSVTRGVQLITRLDGRELGAGPLLQQLADTFAQRAAVDADPAPPRAFAR